MLVVDRLLFIFVFARAVALMDRVSRYNVDMKYRSISHVRNPFVYDHQQAVEFKRHAADGGYADPLPCVDEPVAHTEEQFAFGKQRTPQVAAAIEVAIKEHAAKLQRQAILQVRGNTNGPAADAPSPSEAALIAQSDGDPAESMRPRRAVANYASPSKRAVGHVEEQTVAASAAAAGGRSSPCSEEAQPHQPDAVPASRGAVAGVKRKPPIPIHVQQNGMPFKITNMRGGIVTA